MKPITPQDLRFGNIIQTNKGLLLQVHGINILTAKCSFQNIKEGETNYYYNYNYKDLEPVELTDEILLRLGFVLVNGYYHKNDIWIGKNKIFWYDTDQRHGFVELKYLHQLQNLYFALCGKELELKPKQ